MQIDTTKSNSSHVTELLSAYIDGRVTPVERLNVETHVAGCAECRSQLRSLQATVALLHDLPVAPAPRTFYIYPGMVPEKRESPLAALFRPAWVYGALRLAASVASLLLVMVIAVDALGPLSLRAAAPLLFQPGNRGATQGVAADLSPTAGALAALPPTATTAPTAPAAVAIGPFSAVTSAPTALPRVAAPTPGASREALATPAAPVAPPTALTAAPVPAVTGLAPGAAVPSPAGLGAVTPTPVPATAAKSGTEPSTPTSRPSADAATQPTTVGAATPSPAAAETSRYQPLAPQAPSPQATGAPATGAAQSFSDDGGAETVSPVRALEAALGIVVVALLALTLLARRVSGGKRP